MDENTNFAKAIEKVQEMLSDESGNGGLQNIIEMLSGSEGSEGPQSSNTENSLDISSLFSALGSQNSNNGPALDINTIMKLQSIMSAINQQKNNNDSAFLNALKPMLKKERRDKVDQAVKFLSITKALKAFKDIEGGV